MFSRRAISTFAAVLATGTLAVMSGCDWLHGSEPGSRQSPNISSLVVNPTSVICANNKFTISLKYDDPQGDIAKILVTFQHSEDKLPREEVFLWPEFQSRSNGTLTREFVNIFTCEDKKGLWTFTVQLEDERGHTSNALSGSITLL